MLTLPKNYLINNFIMEKQMCFSNNADASSDSKTTSYNQPFKDHTTGVSEHPLKRMRVLYSGHGKAERNLGMAAIPPLWIPGPPAWRN